MPQVKLSHYVKDRLEDIKDSEDHTSYDSVVRSLLQHYEQDNE